MKYARFTYRLLVDNVIIITNLNTFDPTVAWRFSCCLRMEVPQDQACCGTGERDGLILTYQSRPPSATFLSLSGG